MRQFLFGPGCGYPIFTTGATDRNCAKNIYDAAGNLSEVTTECCVDWVRVVRDGTYDDGSLPSSEGMPAQRDLDSNGAAIWCGFRPILYINE